MKNRLGKEKPVTSRPTLSSRPSERGAAIIEMALVTPLLLLLLLGIVEFGYLFAQYNEIRHAAREGARYAAVSNPDRDGGGVGNSDVLDAVCDSLNLPGSTVTVSITKVDENGQPLAGAALRGDYGRITVTADVGELTNAPIISVFVPDQLTNTAVFRLEQDAAWTSGDLGSCP